VTESNAAHSDAETQHEPRPASGVAAGAPGGFRREQMLAHINEREFVRVGDLSERFAISEVTVRSDLAALALRGLIRRVHGGAMPRAVLQREQPFEQVEGHFAAEKIAIGQAAAALIQDGDAILLDVGTTAAAAARALVARTDLQDVVVFTNGLRTALELEPGYPRISVVVLGGTLRPLQHSLVEPLATTILDQITVKTVLLGCNGVDPVGGVTNINLPEVEIKKRMLKASGSRIVLADSGKIGRVEVASLCGVNEIDLVITGKSAEASVVDEIREQGCDVRLV
jgi:DeoR family transcriptional regulator, aga operon transcriptional repressor